jgi:hypothetical protein
MWSHATACSRTFEKQSPKKMRSPIARVLNPRLANSTKSAFGYGLSARYRWTALSVVGVTDEDLKALLGSRVETASDLGFRAELPSTENALFEPA